MDTVTLTIKPRHLAGTDIARKVRRAGLLPAVMYGEGTQSRAVAVDPKPLKRGLTSGYGRNQIFELEVAGEAGTKLAICKDVQLEPLSRILKHVDFFLVQANSKITVTLPVVLSGRSAGQKAGGRLEFINRKVKVACTPATLPKLVEIDVSPFENGYVLNIADLPLPAGVTPVFKKAFKIFEIIAPKVEEKVAEEPAKKKK